MEEMEPFGYAVTITRKRGLRAIYLRISRTGKVLVSAPSAMALKEVERFVSSKDGWIREKLAQMPAIPCYTYDSGEKHFFLGREYPIVYGRGTVNSVSVEEGKLCLMIGPRTKDRPRAYRNLMKEELRKVIETYIEIWAPAWASSLLP